MPLGGDILAVAQISQFDGTVLTMEEFLSLVQLKIGLLDFVTEICPEEY
jgi:hypothetical protein